MDGEAERLLVLVPESKMLHQEPEAPRMAQGRYLVVRFCSNCEMRLSEGERSCPNYGQGVFRAQETSQREQFTPWKAYRLLSSYHRPRYHHRLRRSIPFPACRQLSDRAVADRAWDGSSVAGVRRC